jgi:hypothetical protein
MDTRLCNSNLQKFIVFLQEQSDELYHFFKQAIEKQYGVEVNVDLGENHIILTLTETGHSGAHASTGIGDDLPYEQERIREMIEDMGNMDENDKERLKKIVNSTTHQTHLSSVIGDRRYKGLGSMLLYLDSIVVYRKLQGGIDNKRVKSLQLLDDSCKDPLYYYSFNFLGVEDTKFTVLDFERLIEIGYIILSKNILNQENTVAFTQLLDTIRRKYNEELYKLHDIRGIIEYVKSRSSKKVMGKNQIVINFINKLKHRVESRKAQLNIENLEWPTLQYWSDEITQYDGSDIRPIPETYSILQPSVAPPPDDEDYRLDQDRRTPKYWSKKNWSKSRRIGGKKKMKSKSKGKCKSKSKSKRRVKSHRRKCKSKRRKL